MPYSFCDMTCYGISGDIDEADRFLRDNHTSEPLADAYAARLIAAERWQDLLNLLIWYCETT